MLHCEIEWGHDGACPRRARERLCEGSLGDLSQAFDRDFDSSRVTGNFTEGPQIELHRSPPSSAPQGNSESGSSGVRAIVMPARQAGRCHTVALTVNRDWRSLVSCN